MIIYSTNLNINKNKIIDEIILIKNWEERYLYIKKLGNFLLKMPNYLKKEENLIQHCNNYA